MANVISRRNTLGSDTREVVMSFCVGTRTVETGNCALLYEDDKLGRCKN